MNGISIEDFYEFHFKDLESNSLILDVRGIDEYKESRISGSLNIPHTELLNNLEKLSGKNKIYIHCKMGGRASMAHKILSSELEDKVELIAITDGGMKRWESNGYPVEK